MIPCYAIDIETPQKFSLRGLWFGPKRAKRVVVWVHGLGSSAFNMRHVMRRLTDEKTAVLAFNNRGHSAVSGLYSTRKGKKPIIVGAAHEKFTDCTDDIQGAINFAKRNGARKIYLAGHSTGCQKSIYWAYKKKSRGVNGIILLAPVSDYAGALAKHGLRKLARAARAARALVKRGKPHEILPASVWSEEPDDAQRFLSLYTPDSVEEIFSYAQPKKNPRILKSVHVPTFVIWAERDEYADRPAKAIATWFEKHIRAPHKIQIVPKVGHGFKGGEKAVARAIRRFMKESYVSRVSHVSG